MAQDITNPIQSMSYTNKDFESIYPELLDLVKELTFKWDPSISNESDPGVILLKLNAIIADKCNYNIDKNVLECFPLSVTQIQNARQLFEQLGYCMKWYRSAVTDISMKWIGRDDNGSLDTSGGPYTIPAFTTVTDTDGGTTYTLVGPSTGTDDDNFKVASQKLPCDGAVIVFKSIQGVAIKYDVNGDELVTVANLDSNNRLYFPTTDIAENGVFICNAGSNNYDSWVRKDNLLVEPIGNTYFKFGITKDGNTCYIEFPEDAETIFKEGINVVYIKTDGANGNIASRTIEKFYSDLSPVEKPELVLSSDNVAIVNTSSASNGRDPENIDSAYKNYKRTIGTFETLVTLRDYINKIVTSGLVSNCFVCDRTNDVQSTYDIISEVNGINQPIRTIEKTLDPYYGHDVNTLTAFSLKLYLLQYVNSIDTAISYNRTFDMVSNSGTSVVKNYIEDIKSIQHDYVDIQPTNPSTGKSHFCYFKNKYPVNCRIVPQYELTSVQVDEVKRNVVTALYNGLNSNEVEFGSDIDINLVYEIIKNSDNRIKNVMIDNIEYTTYAVYFDGSSFKEIEINSDDDAPFSTSCSSEDITVNVDYEVYAKKSGIGDYSTKYFAYDYMHERWNRVDAEGEIISQGISIEEWGISIEGELTENVNISVSQSLKTQFRDEIYAKAVLNGVTQLLVKDERFDYRINQVYTPNLIGDDNGEGTIAKIAANVDIDFGENRVGKEDNTEYELRDNESVQFFAPNLLDVVKYSNYVKFEYYITSDVTKNTNYQLKKNEYVIMYWKSDSNEASLYKYYLYGEGNVISPTFDMPGKVNQEGIVGTGLVKGQHNIGTPDSPKMVADSEYNGDMPTATSDKVAELTRSNILSGTRYIVIRELNQVILTNSNYCYWILNDADDGKYVLFEEDKEGSEAENYYKRILNTGEYFFYANSNMTDLIVLGSGTEIIRSTSPNGKYDSEWSVEVVDSSDVLNNGTSALENSWFRIPDGVKVTATENQYLTLGPGCVFKVAIKNRKNVYTLKADYIRDGFHHYDYLNVDKDVWYSSPAKYQVGEFNFTRTNTDWITREEGEAIVVDIEGTYGITIVENEGVPVVEPQYGDIIRIEVTNDWGFELSRDGIEYSKEGINLSDFDIRWKTYASEEYTNENSLDAIAIDSHTGWDARSLLGINISNVDEQVLLDRQTIEYKLVDGTEGVIDGEDKESYFLYTCDGSEDYGDKFTFNKNNTDYNFTLNVDPHEFDLLMFYPETTKLVFKHYGEETELVITEGTEGTDITDKMTYFSNYPVTLLGSFVVNNDSGESMSTFTEDEYGGRKYLAIYKFAQYIQNDEIIYDSNGSALFTFSSGVTDKQLTFSLPKGRYILPVENGKEGLIIHMYFDGEPMHTIYHVNGAYKTTLEEKKIYYLDLQIEDDSIPHVLRCSVDGDAIRSGTTTVPVRNPYRYVAPQGMSEFQFQKMMGIIEILDDNAHIFNYTYEVPSDNAISNPLDSKSFNDIDHPFNQYTICMMDILGSTTDIRYK